MPAPARLLTIPHQSLKTRRPPPRLPFSALSRLPAISSNTVGAAIAVFARVVQDARRGLAVAARAPGFLIETLEALGHGPVRYEPHVLLIDAHAERRRRDYDVVAGSIRDPFLLARDPLRGGEAGMVGSGADVVRAQARGERVAVGTEGDVDNAGEGVGAGLRGLEFGGAGGVGGAAGVDGLEPGEEGGVTSVVLVGGEADFVMKIGAGCGCDESFQG